MPFADWPVRFEIGDGRAIGRRFLAALVAQHGAARRLHAARDMIAGCQIAPIRSRGAIRGTGDGGTDAQHSCNDRHGLCAGKLFAQALLVAAGDMACLVRKHADDLVGRLGAINAPVLMKMRRPVTNALNDGVVDQHDLDAGTAEPRGLRGQAAHIRAPALRFPRRAQARSRGAGQEPAVAQAGSARGCNQAKRPRAGAWRCGVKEATTWQPQVTDLSRR
jgi:hypothetical protein